MARWVRALAPGGYEVPDFDRYSEGDKRMVALPRGVLPALVILALGSAGAPAAAQFQVIERGGMGYSGDPLMLLRMAQVQEELQLVEDQKVKLSEIEEAQRKQTREQWEAIRDLSPEQRQAKYSELRKRTAAGAEEARKKVEAILLPQQMKRLQQISTQLRIRSRGPSGIADDPALAKELTLTPQQKDKLQKIAEETRKKLQDLPRQIMEEGRKEAMEVLTAEQKKKLEDAIGEKFEFQWSRPRTAEPGGARIVPKVKPKH